MRMRVAARADGLSAHAVAGPTSCSSAWTYQTTVSTDSWARAEAARAPGPQTDALPPNFLVFKVNDEAMTRTTEPAQNPFQEFLWGDYTCS